MTNSSYFAHGLAENEPLAKRYQKHPRGQVRARFPRSYVKMKASLAGASIADPIAVTLTPTSISHLLAVAATAGTLGVTTEGTGTAPTMAYALVTNPGNYFSIAGNLLKVAATLPVSGTIAISVSGTSSPENIAVTTPITVTLT